MLPSLRSGMGRWRRVRIWAKDGTAEDCPPAGGARDTSQYVDDHTQEARMNEITRLNPKYYCLD